MIVPLTAKAFDTLEVLVRSAGHTVTKDEFFKQVWPDTFVQEDTLTQNISTIRRALGDSPDSPSYVLTVPREGYRFLAPVEIVRAQPIPGGSRQIEQPPASTLPQSPSPGAQPWIVHYLVGAVSGLVLAAIGLTLWHRLSDRPDGDDVPATFEVL
jgi:DNA-binding winged helix-turn-helix (wHTH) protein